MLTSAITTYFGSSNLDQSEHEILSKMEELRTENEQLTQKIDTLTQMIQKDHENKSET